jgi:hypothetical protein
LFRYTSSLLLASALALSGATEGPQQTSVLLQMKTSYTAKLTCNFNSNALPFGGACYSVPSLLPCPNNPTTIDACNAVVGCQWSPKMTSCKVGEPSADGVRNVTIDNSEYFKPGWANIVSFLVWCRPSPPL